MTSAAINLPFITADATGPKHLDMTLSRAKFNELTADLVEKTMGPVRQALQDSGLSINEISKVLLVGGSSRFPLFRMLSRTSSVRIPSRASTLTNAWPSAQPFRPAFWAAKYRACCCWMSRPFPWVWKLWAVL